MFEQIRLESKSRETDLRKERDDLQIEQVRLKTQLKQEVENKTEEVNLLQGKVQRLEKARDELEAQIEKVSKVGFQIHNFFYLYSFVIFKMFASGLFVFLFYF